MTGPGEAIEKATKLPFANYDIVVYFGVGICSLPFFNRYILAASNSKNFPSIFNGYSDPLINNIVSIVALVFGVYIIGHGIAILSAMLIEKFLFKTAGTPSKIIARSLNITNDKDSHFISDILTQTRNTYRSPAISDLIRAAFHLPVILVYALIIWLRLFGFYQSKVNGFVVARVQQRLESNYDYHGAIISDTSWFKIVEYACSNDHPAAMLKMYNYLLIYGLFRSMAFIILCATWCELYFFIFQGGLGFVDTTGPGNIYFRIGILQLTYWVSFVGYGKFSRRYAEEAVQAFALSDKFRPMAG